MIARSVVVGLDGSEASRDAAVLGRRLARAAGGSIHLVATADDPLADVVAVELGLDVDRAHRLLVDRIRQETNACLNEEFDAAEQSRLLTVRLGRPGHALATFAEEVGADLFVLGGHERSAPGSWFRRGTAHHLLRSGPRPLLVTGPDGPEVDRVVAAVDLSDAAEPTLEIAGALAGLLGADFEVVHVSEVPDFAGEIETVVEPARSFDAAEDRATKALWERLLPPGVPRRRLSGGVVHALKEYVTASPSTLLVLGAQGRGWVHRLLIGSTTEALLAELPCSLAIVPVDEPGAS